MKMQKCKWLCILINHFSIFIAIYLYMFYYFISSWVFIEFMFIFEYRCICCYTIGLLESSRRSELVGQIHAFYRLSIVLCSIRHLAKYISRSLTSNFQSKTLRKWHQKISKQFCQFRGHCRYPFGLSRYR